MVCRAVPAVPAALCPFLGSFTNRAHEDEDGDSLDRKFSKFLLGKKLIGEYVRKAGACLSDTLPFVTISLNLLVVLLSYSQISKDGPQSVLAPPAGIFFTPVLPVDEFLHDFPGLRQQLVTCANKAAGREPTAKPIPYARGVVLPRTKVS